MSTLSATDLKKKLLTTFTERSITRKVLADCQLEIDGNILYVLTSNVKNAILLSNNLTALVLRLHSVIYQCQFTEEVEIKVLTIAVGKVVIVSTSMEFETIRSLSNTIRRT